MKKHVQQNIDDIINFTDLSQTASNHINDKKDNQLMLNNSDNKENFNNKQKITSFVEETNNDKINNHSNMKN